MSNASYYEKLRDPRWQRKRLEIMQRDDFSCVDCRNAKNTLNVHHRYYVKGRDPWEYPDWSLLTLCEECHSSMYSEEDGSPIQEWEHVVSYIMPQNNSCIEEWDLHTTLGIAMKAGFTKSQCLEEMLSALSRLIESRSPEINWEAESKLTK